MRKKDSIDYLVDIILDKLCDSEEDWTNFDILRKLIEETLREEL